MKKREENTKLQLEYLRRYKLAIYASAAVSFILLISGIVTRELYSGTTEALMSESADSIFFELVILVSGAILTSSIIGGIFEQFQSRMVQDETSLRRRYVDEGIIRVFDSATDPSLISFLLNEIKESRSEVMAVGMGLGILSHNPKLVEAIAERCKRQPNYTLKILVGDQNNNGIKNRIEEEKSSQESMGLNYDEKWISRYPSEIRGLLQNYIPSSKKGAYEVKLSPTCPMISGIKVDNSYLFFAYGTPNIKGSQSPWILVDGESDKGAMRNFLRRIFEYYASV